MYDGAGGIAGRELERNAIADECVYPGGSARWQWYAAVATLAQSQAEAGPAADGDTTLFEAALLRRRGQAAFSALVILTGAQHLDHVEAQLPNPANSQIIIEP